MSCPRLAELPPPPANRAGWPWTEESARLPDSRTWPRVTVVTPSFNQGEFIEETIRSILLQGYPNLEYFVIDGGSTDHTLDVIAKYSQWIDFWVSERDGGQSAAINRGLSMASGSYATWINSDDLLCRDALSVHFLKYHRCSSPDAVYIGDCVDIDEGGRTISVHRGRVHFLEDLLRVRSVWQSGGYISQQEVLFPLELVKRVGGLNEKNHYSMDYELWGRFLVAGATFNYTGLAFGCFRRHAAQKTSAIEKQIASTLDVAEELLQAAQCLPARTKANIAAELRAYRHEHPEIVWRHTGRLARLGLPRSLVMCLRRVRQVAVKPVN